MRNQGRLFEEPPYASGDSDVQRKLPQSAGPLALAEGGARRQGARTLALGTAGMPAGACRARPPGGRWAQGPAMAAGGRGAPWRTPLAAEGPGGASGNGSTVIGATVAQAAPASPVGLGAAFTATLRSKAARVDQKTRALLLESWKANLTLLTFLCTNDVAGT